jgi:hypothetical protein
MPIRIRAAIKASFAVTALSTIQSGLAADPAPPVLDTEVYETIEVVGVRNPFRISPEQLRDGVNTFNAKRPALAPQARILIKIVGYGRNPELNGVKFRLSPIKGGDPIALVPDAEGYFELPNVNFNKTRYELLANRKTGTVRLSIFVFSPGTDLDNRTMGDLRLECAVAWSVGKHDASLLAKSMIGLAGGACTSKRVGVYFNGSRPAKAVNLTYAGKTVALPTTTKGAYRPPVYDKKVPHSARLQVVLR